MRISDWSSDVCSSDLTDVDDTHVLGRPGGGDAETEGRRQKCTVGIGGGEAEAIREEHDVGAAAELDRGIDGGDANRIVFAAIDKGHHRAGIGIDLHVDSGIEDRKRTRLNYSHYCAIHIPTTAQITQKIIQLPTQ